MQRHQPNTPLAVRAHLWLSRVLVFLAASLATGAGFAQQAPAPDLEDGKHGGTHTTYRVVNLAPGLLASIPDINASGQATFSMQSGSGTADAYFYNGNAVQNIGTLGGLETLAADVNDLGQVTGRSTTASGIEHAFVWSAGRGMLDILAPWGSGYSYASAINNRGVVTGAFMPNGVNAYRWSPVTGLENLGAFTPGLTGLSWGSALNDAGLIAGTSDTGPVARHAFIWTRAGGLVDIDNLDSLDAMPIAVGPRGEVAGNRLARGGNDLYSGFLWTQATGMVDLGKAGGTAMYVLSLTPNLRMAGFIRRGDDIQRAMAWTRSTGTRDIGTLGGASSRAYDVNTAGQVVGYAETRSGSWRAFIWTAREGMLDLNRYLRHPPRGLVLDDALAISENGVIVATSNAGLVLLKPDNGRRGGHVVGPVMAPALVKAGVPLQASVAFVDEDGVGTRSIDWSWGDGTANAGAIDGDAGHAAHSYAAPGIYPVTATVVDRAGGSTVVSHTVVVTAAAGGMVAGAGTLVSPAGALRQAPAQSGKASFSMLAPVAATTAADSTAGRLHFSVPGLQFRSEAVRFVDRQGAQQVFAGSGMVRGASGYQFRLSTSAPVRGEPGRFALKIWHTDLASKAEVVDYDNAATPSGTAATRMTQGSIVQE
jgi:probable HAF family extracellular repeat protein